MTIQNSIDDRKGGIVNGETTIKVNPGSGPTEEMPWKGYTSGALTTGYVWQYILGCHFIPKVDRSVTQLGALIHGPPYHYALGGCNEYGSGTNRCYLQQ